LLDWGSVGVVGAGEAMSILPPNAGVKQAQARDLPPKPRPPRAEVQKIAWAESIADAPKMLMGRGPDGRFVSLKVKK